MMDLPKFKIGEKVRNKTTKQVFTIRSMYWYQDSGQKECRYLDRGISADESELETYKEPKETFTRKELEHVLRYTIKLVQTEYKGKYSDSLERAEIVMKVLDAYN